MGEELELRGGRRGNLDFVPARAINMTHEFERERGGITKDDRKYIRGRSNLTDSTVRDAKKRIRSRIHNVLLDFPILVEDLDRELRKEAFIGNTRDSIPPELIYESASDAIAFIYLCCSDFDSISPETEVPSFEQVVRSGIERGANQRNEKVLDLVITVETEPEEVGELVKKYETGEDLTASEIRTLLNAGKIDDDEYFSDTGYSESDRREAMAEDARAERR